MADNAGHHEVPTPVDEGIPLSHRGQQQGIATSHIHISGQTDRHDETPANRREGERARDNSRALRVACDGAEDCAGPLWTASAVAVE